MTGNEVQELVEMERNRMWEEINAPDPAETLLEQAATELKVAVKWINTACVRIITAQSYVSGYPMEDVVGSFYDQLLDFESQLEALANKYEKGER